MYQYKISETQLVAALHTVYREVKRGRLMVSSAYLLDCTDQKCRASFEVIFAKRVSAYPIILYEYVPSMYIYETQVHPGQ